MSREILNRLLAYLNIAVTKRSTLSALERELARLQQAECARDQTVQAIAQRLEGTELAVALARNEGIKHQIALKWSIIDTMEARDSGRLQELTCPLCDHADVRATFVAYEGFCSFGGGRLSRHQCPRCDLIFGPQKMLTLTGAELALEYQWHYLVYAEGDSTEQELRAFHALEPRRDGVYLNYGAGSWSRTLKILRGEGWNVYGFEPHGDASPAGSEVISKRETLAGMRFDGIFSNNVLEHLRHPADELRAMSNLLNAGARMVHATPCFEYLYEYTRFHLFFYLGRSREMLGQQAGLTLDQFIKDDEFMACVWRKSTQ